MLPNDWSQLQQAAKVQRQFLEMRLKTLGNEASKHLDALQEKIEVLYKQETSRDCPNWFDVYNKIGDSLRKSDLTINLKSTSWFFKDNTYKRYTQTYQRNTDKQTGITQLKDDSLNPAAIRGTVDDRVTLPEDWRKTSKFSQKRKMYDALSFSGSALPADADDHMRDDGKGFAGYLSLPKDNKHSKLKLGKVEKPTKENVEKTYSFTADTTNQHFNSNAKQVFAAINYGRRQHGSSTGYGSSYLILDPELKEKCIYFPGDTFYFRPTIKGKDGKVQSVAAADAQVTHDWLGHILLWAGYGLDAAIFKSCYSGEVLGDTAAPGDLVEAHLFSDIRVDRDAQELRLAREDGTSPEVWETIKTNAYEWCKRNQVRLYLMDA